MSDEKKIRARFKAEAADHPSDKGYQAIVRETDPETGETKAAYRGKAASKTQRDAIKIGKVWIDAEVGRHQRLDMLAGRREGELPQVLERNNERIDDLKEQRGDLTNAIKKLEEENRALVRETCHPEVTIVMYEATQTYAYTFVEKGKRVEVDERQLGLFSDGVPDANDGDGDGESPPDIHDLADDGDKDGDDAY